MDDKSHGSGSVDPSEKEEINREVIEVMKKLNIPEEEMHKVLKFMNENPELFTAG